MAKKEKKATQAVKQPAEHLAPYKFKEGQSGNPAGRPPGRTVHKEVREAAVGKIEEWFDWLFLKPEEELTEHLVQNENLSRADKVILKDADKETVNAILDRVVGKPAQVKVEEHTGGESAESLLRRLINGGNNGQA